MSNPDDIRADIEVTRRELGEDVDALADKVTPGKIMERQRTRLRRAFDDARERVMGVAEDVGQSASDIAQDTAHGVAELPRRAARTAQGAPLAVGLVAFGLGWLAASLTPPSDAERRAARSLRDAAQPLMAEAADVAKTVAADLEQPARDAVEQVKAAATESAEHVKEEAQDTAERVKENVGTGGGEYEGTAAADGPAGRMLI